MANREKSHSIPLVLIALFFVFLVSNSDIALAAQEIRLSEDIGENGAPSIYGDKVVWAYWDKIHLSDLKTGNDTTITMPEHYYVSHPAIYDNKIVCCLYNVNENPVRDRLYVYDILNSTSSLITENLSHCVPDIYGDRIVWAEERNYKTDVYTYNISTQIKTQITTSGSASNPSIYENKIVWEDSRCNGIIIDKNNNSISGDSICIYDLSTKKETMISTSGRAYAPVIYSDRIVWQDSRNSDFTGGRGDVYMYNLSTEKESRISYSGQSSLGSPPAIYGDRIVGRDRCNGKEDIYMYNLSTQKETQITTSGSAHDPDIYGDRIVYRKYSRHRSPVDYVFFSDIYVYDLTARPMEPQTGFTSNVTLEQYI